MIVRLRLRVITFSPLFHRPKTLLPGGQKPIPPTFSPESQLTLSTQSESPDLTQS